jgi:hypothetical protein
MIYYFNLLRMGLLKPNIALRQNLKWQLQIPIAPDYKEICITTVYTGISIK